MAGTPRMSAVLLDEAAMLADRVEDAFERHGIRTAEAMAVLRLAQAHERRCQLHDTTEKVKEQMSGPDGLEGTRAKRSLREHYRDAPWLRLVVDNTEPEPPGAPAAQREAA